MTDSSTTYYIRATMGTSRDIDEQTLTNGRLMKELGWTKVKKLKSRIKIPFLLPLMKWEKVGESYDGSSAALLLPAN